MAGVVIDATRRGDSTLSLVIMPGIMDLTARESIVGAILDDVSAAMKDSYPGLVRGPKKIKKNLPALACVGVRVELHGVES